MTISRLQPWRRLVHYLLLILFVAFPFLRIGGESALRFDIPSLRLHVFGASIMMDEFFLVLVAVLFLTFLFILATLLFGRIWCGWLCPQVLLVDLTSSGGGKGRFPGAVSHMKALPVSVFTGAVTVWYFISPYDFFRDLGAGELSKVAAWSWLILSLLAWLDLALVRYTFCATVCPYSRFQGVMFDRETMVIAFDRGRAAECLDCSACVKACPAGIDIRSGLQAACVNCAECRDVCRAIQERKKKSSLVGYFFGVPGSPFRPWRPAVLAAAVPVLAFLLLLLHLVMTRAAVDLTVLPSRDFESRRSPSGGIVASYVLSLANRGREEISLLIAAEGPGGPAEVSPSSVKIGAGGRRRLTVFVAAGGEGRIAIILSTGSGEAARAVVDLAAPSAP